MELEKHQFEEGELEINDSLEDITDKVFGVWDELNQGEMVSRENFDLSETMSGFELMDPKMDCKAKKDELFSIRKAKEAGSIKEEYPESKLRHFIFHIYINTLWFKIS